jgi:UDP-4-amino-4,6-dideoxy-N-acetyl-beta-L-altrosamine N-acetyltransferase
MFTQHEISLDEHRNWFAKASQDSTRRLLIVEEGQHPIGYVQFSNVFNRGIADWGFYARPDVPKGSGRKLGATALDYAFGALNLHKVCGQAINSNQASIAFHKRLGFTQEGVLRDQRRIGCEYHTVICFGLLEHEWHYKAFIKENTNAKD